MNAVDPASAMGPADCAYSFNLIPAEGGLQARGGYQEWATGLTGGVDNTVRTMISFTGSASNGAGDRLFAVTANGIWAVSDSTTTPSPIIEFPNKSGAAGFGVYCSTTTVAGKFILYCDEVNGLYTYTESSDLWAQAVSGVTQHWATGTDYAVGNQVVNGDYLYTCTVAGTSVSSGAGPVVSTGTTTDGTVTWAFVSGASTGVIGPSLADQNNGFTADPANFVSVTVWKSRVWFVERDTSRAYYGGVNSIFGTFTSFDFGSRMRAGGPLVGLFNWSYDGGNGLDTSLVGISGAGDVVIYQGTDPTTASTFGLKGCWYVGGVPAGRNIATDTGGDLLIISLLGVLPLSRLVLSSIDKFDQTQYATRQVGPVFARLAATYGAYRGWAIHVHPTDNVLLVTIPTGDGAPTTQLAMSFATKGWFPYRDLPILSACVWNHELYFGTADGRVCRNTGFVDNVLIIKPDSWDPVKWSVLPAFRNLGNSRNKQVQMMRPIILSETPNANVRSTARYDYNVLEPAYVTGNGGGGDGAWDSAVWDAAVWGGAYSTTQALSGATGMGRAVSIAMQGNAIGRTVLVGVDVLFKQGGLL
jgi:hypothetical protein